MQLLLLSLWLLAPAAANLDAKRLYDDLMSSYNSLIRPVSNVSDRLTVKVGVRLTQLVDVVSSKCLLHPSSPVLVFSTEPQEPDHDDEHVG